MGLPKLDLPYSLPLQMRLAELRDAMSREKARRDILK